MISNTTERLLIILASILTILQIIYAIIKTLWSFQVPFWLFATTAISCFWVGFFVRKIKKNSKTRVKLKKIGQVKFDYLPDSPEKHRWKIGLESEKEKSENLSAPEFFIAKGSPIPGSLGISHSDRYYMDLEVDQTQGMSDLIEFYCKYIREGAFYLKVKVTSRDESQSRLVWLCYLPASEEARKAFENEWQVPIPGEVLEDGWTAARISIADEISKTFGNDGWVHRSIKIIRLRGSLSISPITFYKFE